VKLQSIPIEEFAVKPQHIWDEQNLLLTSGDFGKGHFNSMTVGWGSMGVMWGMPFAQVVVRPTRFTYEFIERYDTFTLCGFAKEYEAALELLGTKSGRDGDKITESGLTPVGSTRVSAPSFAQAELVLECRKIYRADMNPAQFLDERIERRYPKKDYHRIYYGEILVVLQSQK
jgi:flavin reductase (DIM6/NTAB) family NADH-FMN oxidoreductase RutF